MLHYRRMCSIVCTRLPHGHLPYLASPQQCMVFCVLPTLDLALLRVTQSFLGRLVPLGSSSCGSWTALFCGVLSHCFHSFSLKFAASSELILSFVYEAAAGFESAPRWYVAIESVSGVSFLFELLSLSLGCAPNMCGRNPVMQKRLTLSSTTHAESSQVQSDPPHFLQCTGSQE